MPVMPVQMSWPNINGRHKIIMINHALKMAVKSRFPNWNKINHSIHLGKIYFSNHTMIKKKMVHVESWSGTDIFDSELPSHVRIDHPVSLMSSLTKRLHC